MTKREYPRPDKYAQDYFDRAEELIADAYGVSGLQRASRNIEAALGFLEDRASVPVEELDARFDVIKEALFKRLTEIAVDDRQVWKMLLDERDDKDILDSLRQNSIVTALRLVEANRQSKGTVSPDCVIYTAQQRGSFDTLFDECLILRLLVSEGLEVNARLPRQGHTSLHLMAWTGFEIGSIPRMVRLLLKHGAEPDPLNHEGETPLSRICKDPFMNTRNLKSAVMLISAGADPHHPRVAFRTPYESLKLNASKEPSDPIYALISFIER